jgi:hypothetical protein
MNTAQDTAVPILDEATRPGAPSLDDGFSPNAQGRAVGAHFREVHEGYRIEMREVLTVLDAVLRDTEQIVLAAALRGTEQIATARGELHKLAIRANDWRLGGYCQAQCLSLTEHHNLEDEGIFPHLRSSQPNLGPVLDRLDEEHHAIHDLLERVDGALIHLVAHPGEHERIDELIRLLNQAILSHFAYEEEQLTTPLMRYGFYAGQV